MSTNRPLLFCVLLFGCKSGDNSKTPPAKEPAPAPTQPAPPAEVAVTPTAGALPASASKVRTDYVTTNAEQTRYAGRAIDFTSDWKGMHERLKEDAKRLMQPTQNVPNPTGKLTIWVYDATGDVPDLKTTEENAIPSEHLLARYGNSLGKWQYCFDVSGAGKCVFEDDPMTPTFYDPRTPEKP
jgi:hypothetical protein